MDIGIRSTKNRSFWRRYSIYIASEEWAALVRLVRYRDEYMCRGCCGRGALQTAHLTYERFQHEELDDLLTLCDDCHVWLDDKTTPWTKAQKIRYLIRHPHIPAPAWAA